MAISRRSLIVSGACVIAAPAIVRVTSIMPVKVLAHDAPVRLIPGVNCSIYPNAYGWWQIGRAIDRKERKAAGIATDDIDDDTVEAWNEDIRQRFGQAAADTHCGPLLAVDRKIRGLACPTKRYQLLG